MRNTSQENISQHSLEVSMIAHALAVINNEIFGGDISPEKTAVIAMYHDMSEIITGDMPTPVKYKNTIAGKLCLIRIQIPLRQMKQP